MIGQVPQSQVEQVGGARLHAEDGTALHVQPELRQQCRQLGRLVAPAMTDEIVEGRPMRLMQRHGEQQRAAGGEYSGQLAQCAEVIFDMLDDVHRADQVERSICKRQVDDRSGLGACTGLTQSGDGSLAGVDEASSRQRQARAQAGGDFEATRIGVQQRFDQRPGIEPLRGDQPRLVPQRLVEAAVGPLELGFFGDAHRRRIPQDPPADIFAAARPTRALGQHR